MSTEFSADDFFPKRGGLLTLESFEDEHDVHHVYENLLRMIENRRRSNPKLPYPFIDFIDNMKFVACSGKVKGEYMIGLSIGTYLILRDAFHRMMVDGKVLPEFGDVSGSTEIVEKVNYQAYGLYFYDPDPYHTPFSKDEVRLKLANFLFDMAYTFLASHEYGHIINGHNDLILNNNGHDLIEDLDFRDNLDETENLLYQTLEMDADSHATSRAMDGLMLTIRDPKHLSDGLKPFFSSMEEVLKLWAFSIYTLFRIWREGETTVESLKKRRHPTGSMRINTILIVANTFLAKFFDEAELQRFQVAIRSGAGEAEIALKQICKQVPDRTDLEFSLLPEVLDFQTATLKNWTTVFEMLKPYAYNKLVTPT